MVLFLNLWPSVFGFIMCISIVSVFSSNFNLGSAFGRHVQEVMIFLACTVCWSKEGYYGSEAVNWGFGSEKFEKGYFPGTEEMWLPSSE